MPLTIRQKRTDTSIATGVGFLGCPPCLASNGNLYVIGSGSGADVGKIKAFKTSDGASWSEVDSANRPTTDGNGVNSSAGCQVGDVAHVILKTTINGCFYSQFNMATDAWSIHPAETVGLGGTTNISALMMTVRSNSDVIVTYNGATQRIMGTDYSRVYWARRVSGVWTVNVSIDGNTSDQTNYTNGGIAGPDASDRVYAFFGVSASTGYINTIRSANTLSGRSTITGLTFAVFSRGYYQGQIVGGVAYVPAMSGSTTQLISATVADTPTWSLTQTLATANNASCLVVEGRLLTFYDQTASNAAKNGLGTETGGNQFTFAELTLFNSNSVSAQNIAYYTFAGSRVFGIVEDAGYKEFVICSDPPPTRTPRFLRRKRRYF